MEAPRILSTFALALKRLPRPNPVSNSTLQRPFSNHFLSQPTATLYRPGLPPRLQQPSRSFPLTSKRTNNTSSDPRPLTDRSDTPPSKDEIIQKEVPAYQLTFTCKPCRTRSAHRISKQGYHHGTVLITCPSCKNRHIISDHLKIFMDKDTTIEDILEQKGELVKKGRLGPDGDMEFWDSSAPVGAPGGDLRDEVKSIG